MVKENIPLKKAPYIRNEVEEVDKVLYIPCKALDYCVGKPYYNIIRNTYVFLRQLRTIPCLTVPN